jgi:methionine-rich copper-binding protein CopC
MGSFRLPTTSLSPALAAAALFLGLAFGIGAADAHAMLDHAEPRVGSTVKAPHSVTLWFTQNLEKGFSSVEVTDSGGTRVSSGTAVSGKEMRTSVKALAVGTYTVRWHVLSVDSHTTEGNFTFTVSP